MVWSSTINLWSEDVVSDAMAQLFPGSAASVLVSAKHLLEAYHHHRQHHARNERGTVTVA